MSEIVRRPGETVQVREPAPQTFTPRRGPFYSWDFPPHTIVRLYTVQADGVTLIPLRRGASSDGA